MRFEPAAWKRFFGRLGAAVRSANLSLVGFVLSLCFFSFAYGLLVVELKLFPHALLKDASDALEAVLVLEDEDLTPGVLEIGEDLPSAPVISKLGDKAGKEDLLIIGGFNQYTERCPNWGCLAWIIDRQGQVLHSWETDLDALVADAPQFAGRPLKPNIYPIGAALAPDGSLYLTFHARNVYPYQIGIAKFDISGRLLWRHFDHSHHWIALDKDGRVYAPSMTVRETEPYIEQTAVNMRCTKEVFDEGIKVYSSDGQLLREFPMLDLFSKADYPGFFYSLRDDCDPAHVNSVDIASPEVAAKLDDVNPGDLLVSVRESSVIAVIDRNTGEIKHLVAGRTAAQHSPKFLPDGSVVAFDNQGGRRALGGTRIAHIDMETDEVQTIFPKDNETRFVPFFSYDGGHLSVSPDGKRVIVSVKDDGRVIEIDMKSGEPLWVMEKYFDISPYLREHRLSSEQKSARFTTHGAYYVQDTGFLSPEPTNEAKSRAY